MEVLHFKELVSSFKIG